MAQVKSKLSFKARTSHPKRAAAQRAVSANKHRSFSSPRGSSKPNTKHAKIVAMLCSSSGATIAAIVTATGWQQHSVRGFLAGVVRKRLKLKLISEQTGKGRIYRIKEKRSGTKIEASKASA